MTHFCADYSRAMQILQRDIFICDHFIALLIERNVDSIQWHEGRSLTKNVDSSQWHKGRSLRKQTEVLLRKGDWWKFWGSSEFVIHPYSKTCMENANIEGDEFDVSHSWMRPHRIDFWALFERLWHASYLCSCKHSHHPAKIISRK